MDKETYYALAILASSLSALLAFVNVFVLLRDRAGGLKLKFMIREGTSSARVFKDLADSNFTEPPEAYKAVVLIENRSSIPVVVTSFKLVSRRFCWLPFIGRQSHDIDGSIVGDVIPAKVDGRDFVILEFRGSVASVNRHDKLVVSTADGQYSKVVPVLLKRVFHRP